jgi:hypothetical protein
MASFSLSTQAVVFFLMGFVPEDGSPDETGIALECTVQSSDVYKRMSVLNNFLMAREDGSLLSTNALLIAATKFTLGITKLALQLPQDTTVEQNRTIIEALSKPLVEALLADVGSPTLTFTKK